MPCGYIPAYSRVRFHIPGISVWGVRHPVEGYGAAAGLGRDESRHAARHARARTRARIRSARGHAPSSRRAIS